MEDSMIRFSNLSLTSAILLLASSLAIFFLRNAAAQEQPPLSPPVGDATSFQTLRRCLDVKSAFYPNGGVNTSVYTSELGPAEIRSSITFTPRDQLANLKESWSWPGTPRKKPTRLLYSAIPFPRRSLKLASGKVTFLFIAPSFLSAGRNLHYETQRGFSMAEDLRATNILAQTVHRK